MVNTPQKYIGKWVTLYIQGGTYFSGKLSEITDDGFMMLNPYMDSVYNSNGKKLKIISNNLGISISKGDNTVILPTTRKSIENYCKQENSLEEKIDTSAK